MIFADLVTADRKDIPLTATNLLGTIELPPATLAVRPQLTRLDALKAADELVAAMGPLPPAERVELAIRFADWLIDEAGIL